MRNSIFLAIAIFSSSLVLYLVSKLCTLEANQRIKDSEKMVVKENFWTDYICYCLLLQFKSGMLDLKTMKAMMKASFSGLLLITSIIWSGFIINQYYNSNLLSSLTRPFYEKPINNIPGWYIATSR